MKHRGIYKRGKIYWICYVDAVGRVRRESTKSTNIHTAISLLAKRRAEAMEGKLPVTTVKKYTFQELVERYSEYVSIQRSYRKFKSYIIQRLKERFADMPLKAFNTQIVEQLQVDLIKEGRKPATINRTIAVLKHMLRKAQEWDMIEEEILKRVRKVGTLKENNQRLRYLTEDEIQRLLASCDSRIYPIVLTALLTGMRKEEILSLKWDNIDLKNGYIHVEKTKNGERRDIPINATLLKTLREIYINRRIDTQYVFVNPETGTRYYDIKRAFRTALKKAKIEDFHFHDLRHTFASHLVMKGVDLTTVKELLGHKEIRMTLRYSHLAPEHKNRAIACLDGLFSTTVNSTSQLLHNF